VAHEQSKSETNRLSGNVAYHGDDTVRRLFLALLLLAAPASAQVLSPTPFPMSYSDPNFFPSAQMAAHDNTSAFNGGNQSYSYYTISETEVGCAADGDSSCASTANASIQGMNGANLSSYTVSHSRVRSRKCFFQAYTNDVVIDSTWCEVCAVGGDHGDGMQNYGTGGDDTVMNSTFWVHYNETSWLTGPPQNATAAQLFSTTTTCGNGAYTGSGDGQGGNTAAQFTSDGWGRGPNQSSVYRVYNLLDIAENSGSLVLDQNGGNGAKVDHFYLVGCPSNQGFTLTSGCTLALSKSTELRIAGPGNPAYEETMQLFQWTNNYYAHIDTNGNLVADSLIPVSATGASITLPSIGMLYGQMPLNRSFLSGSSPANDTINVCNVGTNGLKATASITNPSRYTLTPSANLSSGLAAGACGTVTIAYTGVSGLSVGSYQDTLTLTDVTLGTDAAHTFPGTCPGQHTNFSDSTCTSSPPEKGVINLTVTGSGSRVTSPGPLGAPGQPVLKPQ